MARLAVRLLVILVSLAVALPLAPAQASAFGEKAQRQLNALGCAAGPVDGRIGEMTRAAAVRFQSANQLRQTGTLGRTTRTRLRSSSAVSCDDRPVPGKGKGRRVVLSQTQNYVWLVRKNGSVRAQGPMIDNPSVVSPGTTRVGAKCGRAAKIRMNSDIGGSLWLPFFTRFSPCGVGFHRIPTYKSTGTQIHPDWMLGTNLRESHGCVRLSRSFAAQLWRFGTVGTRVVVTS